MARVSYFHLFAMVNMVRILATILGIMVVIFINSKHSKWDKQKFYGAGISVATVLVSGACAAWYRVLYDEDNMFKQRYRVWFRHYYHQIMSGLLLGSFCSAVTSHPNYLVFLIVTGLITSVIMLAAILAENRVLAILSSAAIGTAFVMITNIFLFDPPKVGAHRYSKLSLENQSKGVLYIFPAWLLVISFSVLWLHRNFTAENPAVTGDNSV